MNKQYICKSEENAWVLKKCIIVNLGKNILKIFPCIQLSYAKLYTLWGAIQLSFLWFQRIWINYTLFYLRGNIMNVKVGPFIFVFNKLHSPKGPHLVKRIRFIVTLSFQYWNRPNMLWFSHFASNNGWIRIAKNQIGLNPLCFPFWKTLL